MEATTFTASPPTVPVLRLPMNNAYVGSIRLDTLRPRFVWEPSTAKSAADIRYELQYSTDRFFSLSATTTVPTLKTSHQPDSPLPVSMEPPVGARYYWRVRACLEGTCSDYTQPWYMNLGRVIKDYDGDGYSDLAVGAPLSDALHDSGGQAYIYYGGTARAFGEPHVLLATQDSTRPERHFGMAISSAGDVNGDGFDDLLVYVQEVQYVYIGQVYLYLGGPRDQFDTAIDVVFLIPSTANRVALAAAGDLNGDGYGDLVIQYMLNETPYADVYLGAKDYVDNTPDGQLTWDSLNGVVASAGDVNGDGYSDLIVGASHDGEAGPGFGAAYLFCGGSGEVFDSVFDIKWQGTINAELFGQDVASAGDLNGDGFADVAVGIHRTALNPHSLPGRAYVFLGRPTPGRSADLILTGKSNNDGFGRVLDTAGDVNADGYSDLIVGGSSAFVYFGGPGAILDDKSDATLLGEFNPLHVFAAGDLNGDGFGDVGAAVWESFFGIEIYRGASKFDPRLAFTIFAPVEGEGFGAGIASLPPASTPDPGRPSP